MDYKQKYSKQITLPDGTETDTWSKEYMYYCEALSFSKKPLQFRRDMLEKIYKRNQLERLDKVKYWLTHIWDKKRSGVYPTPHNGQ